MVDLIVFGEPQAATGAAAVDVKSGELMIWASLPSTAPYLMFDSETAIKKAGFPVGAQAELVWKSCLASRSPMYPIWSYMEDHHGREDCLRQPAGNLVAVTGITWTRWVNIRYRIMNCHFAFANNRPFRAVRYAYSEAKMHIIDGIGIDWALL